jgi:hypothetical protein
MNAQTLTLSGQLATIKKAMDEQVIEQRKMAELIAKAIDNMKESNEKKLEAINKTLEDTNTTLKDKLNLIQGVVASQTLSLEKKFDILNKAQQDNLVKQEEVAKKIAESIDQMKKSDAEKMAEITQAIKDITKTGGVIDLVKGAIEAQTNILKTKLEAIRVGLDKMPNYTTQLNLIQEAIKSMPGVVSKLEALNTSLGALKNFDQKFDAAVKALHAIKNQVKGSNAKQAEIAAKIAETTKAIEALTAQVKEDNGKAQTAYAALKDKLADLQTQLAVIAGKL